MKVSLWGGDADWDGAHWQAWAASSLAFVESWKQFGKSLMHWDEWATNLMRR